MPGWARGAIVTHAPADARAPVPVFWLRHGGSVPDGCVLLSWRARSDGATDVSARLGLANSEVTLALWPSLCGGWTRVVHPTLREVLGLHTAMTLAKDALRLANHLLDAQQRP
ncbi:hypothetical protein ACWGJ2_19565 [Streptomyces sp. NPDC054796]